MKGDLRAVELQVRLRERGVLVPVLAFVFLRSLMVDSDRCSVKIVEPNWRSPAV